MERLSHKKYVIHKPTYIDRALLAPTIAVPFYYAALIFSAFSRQITKGAEAFGDIIEESFAQNQNGTIADSAISKARDKYGIFAPDGSEILAAE